ncbi:ABC transporter ATP-binding protein [Marinobacter sp. CHS3-4]|uniref:ABC transporter ATP-binding protein n=1 Tax=Marinobacter sp. CHS3-4 TaxID=3045174 RepID=UPI0024B56FEF|nr:ABC transporter ATP-binding protein [Marinobacter sp. CHS3-4]MDI9245286.1 ABC transporter ATP-binding protein [Marinobacter sp. CHS3-4]
MVNQTAQNSSEVIRVSGLHNRFGTQVVHESLNLDVQRREILGVVGGSGTGKSVLLRSIVGLHKPDQGDIRLFGQALSDLSPDQKSRLERRLGVLFQGGALFTSLTVQENVALPLIEHFNLSRKDAEHLAKTKLGLVGLSSDALDKYPAMLSGGMVKRAALARALVLDPEILFLDEPTAGLDPIGAAAFDRLIVTLRNALGFTVFLVTHDLDTLYTSCDRVAVLADKKVLISDKISVVESTDNDWIKAYFHGPRGRSSRLAATPNEREV